MFELNALTVTRGVTIVKKASRQFWDCGFRFQIYFTGQIIGNNPIPVQSTRNHHDHELTSFVDILFGVVYDTRATPAHIFLEHAPLPECDS